MIRTITVAMFVGFFMIITMQLFGAALEVEIYNPVYAEVMQNLK